MALCAESRDIGGVVGGEPVSSRVDHFQRSGGHFGSGRGHHGVPRG
jgi:hypothetical protein